MTAERLSIALNRLTVEKGGRSETIECRGERPLTLSPDDLLKIGAGANRLVLDLRDGGRTIVDLRPQ